LIFDLRVAKTKVALLEEKLANIEIGRGETSSPTSIKNVNVTVHSNNYGCFGIGGFG